VNFKVLSLSLNAERLADLILLCLNPLVKCREAKLPVFAHANARDSVLTGEFLKGLYMNAKVFRSFVCCSQRLERVID